MREFPVLLHQPFTAVQLPRAAATSTRPLARRPCMHRCIPLTRVQVPYTPVSSSNNTAGLDQATQERLERMENVLSVVVRHNPGLGGYDAIRDWLNCKSKHYPYMAAQGRAGVIGFFRAQRLQTVHGRMAAPPLFCFPTPSYQWHLFSKLPCILCMTAQ